MASSNAVDPTSPQPRSSQSLKERMELIFPNFLKKDGFKYMRLERDIADSTSNVVKGIDMIDVDDLLERLLPHWQQEILLRKLSWKISRQFHPGPQNVP